MYLKVHNLLINIKILQLKSEVSLGNCFIIQNKMFTHCERAQIFIKADKNIELTIPFVQLPNHVCFQTANYDATINKI
jgi:hypothetical protein